MSHVVRDEQRLSSQQQFGANLAGTSTLPLDTALVNNVRKAATAAGTHHVTFTLALLGMLLRRYGGQEEVVLGVLRDQGDPTAVPLALPLNVAGDPRFDELLQRVPLAAPVSPDRLDLILKVEESSTGLGLSILLPADPLAAWLTQRLAGHLAQALQAVVANPQLRLSEVPLLTDEERHQLLVEWNQTSLPYPRQMSIPALFEAVVRTTPDATALVCGDQSLTYRELNGRANQLAHYLLRHGLPAESPVGILMDRSLAQIVSALAVLKAGGAYVPMDPAYPQERLSWMMSDAQVAVLLAGAPWWEQYIADGRKVICPDLDGSLIDREPAENPGVAVGPEQLAYICYTSGSTGRPKGVMIPHRGVVRLTKGVGLPFESHEVFMHTSSFAFDASTWEIWAPLLNGATLVLMEPGRLDPAAVGATIQRNGVTTLFTSTGLFHLMVSESLESLSGVKRLIAGGEAMSVAHARKLARAFPECLLINGYGPTENTTVTCSFAVTNPDGLGGSVPIGRPVGNTTVYLLDPWGQPTPVGVPGELYTGGDGLARGYLNRPELTEERFVPDPFRPGERLYRTGDLVRYLPDGNLEFLGRIDDQVKVRGYRIELGEIETVLGDHPAVQANVVVARERAPGEKDLIAYAVIRDGAPTPTVTDLRAHLAARLPEFMLPQAFVMLEALPLTPNGKVNRARLPDPGRGRPALAVPYVPPRTQAESELAAICADVLGLDPVGVHDNLLEIGAHSLRITQIAARMQERFGSEVAMADLFAHPTVAELAGLTGQALPPASAATSRIAPVPHDHDLPLSFSQERVWFLEHLNPELRAYQAQAIFRLNGALDVPALERALTELIRRHEIFRTTFHAMPDGPVQRIHAPFPIRLAVTPVHGEAELKRHLQAVLDQPFDPAALPLVRWALYQLAPREHVLLHVEHHFVHDGWSFAVFVRELGALYEAFVHGQESPLPEPSVQYADWVCWHREWARSEEAERQLAYWKRQLAGAPPLLKLPADRPRPPVQSFRGSSKRIELPSDLANPLRRLCRQEGVTLFMAMFAGFVSLLHRLTRSEDLCVGTGVANRRLRESEGIIGMIVNSVALRTDLSGAPSFRELLRRVARVTLEAYANQDLPFDQVVEALAPERSLSYSPLFQALFSFHDSPMPDRPWPGVDLQITEALSNGSAKFDLNVVAIPRAEQQAAGSDGAPDEITMIWEYSTDLFTAATIERMIVQYERLLRAAVADPGCPVDELVFLPDAERQQLLAWGTETAIDYPAASTIHALVEAQAARQPEAVAVIFGETQLTYGELNRRANQIAHRLRREGVGPDVCVGVLMERSENLIVALLSILKAGGAYVALDPNYPAERLAFMLEDAAVPVLLTDRSMLDRAPAIRARMLCLEEAAAAMAGEPAHNPDVPVLPHHLAYICYTSGSTGQPKGAMVPHRSVVRLAYGGETIRVEPDEIFLQLGSIAFDASTWEIWTALIRGVRLAVMEQGPFAPADVVRTVRRYGVTSMFLVPAVFNLIVEEGGLDGLGSVRQLVLGGEALSVVHTRKAARALPGCRIINGYGPTENTSFTTYHVLTDPDGLGASVPIGRPVPNTVVYLFEPNRPGALVPIGVPGELYTGGDGLARGYLGRPELTEERFLPDPFRPGQRIYRTGDLARWLPDGTIEFLGRLDDQVKVRGIRIELGEIEVHLAAHPHVKTCAVVVREDSPGAKQLVAYLVPAEGVSPDIEELRRHLHGKLPGFMVPQAFVVLEALPLSPNGKVVRRALPAPARTDLENDAAYVPPQTAMQSTIAAVWAEVLGVERLSIHDSFFELGGNSLKIPRVIARLGALLGVRLSLRDLYEAPTVALLAERAETAGRLADRSEIRPRTATGPIPATFSQERLWLLHQLGADCPAYHIPVAFWLTGPVEPDTLERAIRALAARHESLRTHFQADGDRLLQVVPTEPEITLACIDLEGLPQEQRKEEAIRLAVAEAVRPFDLTRGPLLRPMLIRIGPDQHLFAVHLHHIIFDGSSLNIFLRELSELYAADLHGRSPLLPPVTVQYADYALWQQEHLAGPTLEEQTAYWRERLAGMTPSALPTDRPRPEVQRFRGTKVIFTLPDRLAEGIKQRCGAAGVTPFQFFLAAFMVLLQRYSGQGDIAVSTPVANRERPELAGVIGYLTNTLILRAECGDNPTFDQLLARVRDEVVGALLHQGVPLEHLVAELLPEWDQRRSPLYYIMFLQQSVDRGNLTLEGVRAEPVVLDLDTTADDLTWSVEEEQGRYYGLIQYDSDLFEPATIDRMVQHYIRLLEQVAADPSRPIGDYETRLSLG